MIKSYRDKQTAAFASGEFVRQFQGFSRQAYKRLDILDAAASLGELGQLPSNRLEALHCKRAGQFSIRITNNGASVLSGQTAQPAQRMSRSSIIIEE